VIPAELGAIPQLEGVDLDGSLWARARAAAGARGSAAIGLYLPSFKRYATSELCNAGSCGGFPAISITGGKCALMCAHCRGRLLRHMTPAPDPEALWDAAAAAARAGAKGALITGGSDEQGRLPLGRFIPVIEKIKTRLDLTVAVHTGLIDRQTARSLASAGADTAMIDIIGSDETIREVYHLGKRVEDFERSLAALCETPMAVTPHIVAGLHFGAMKGERRALEIVSSQPVQSLIVVVVVSHHAADRTLFSPPGAETVGSFLHDCRRALRATPLILGCARPGGEHKLKTDLYALAAGVDGVAFPSDGVVEAAKALGLSVAVGYSCCSVTEAPPAA